MTHLEDTITKLVDVYKTIIHSPTTPLLADNGSDILRANLKRGKLTCINITESLNATVLSVVSLCRAVAYSVTKKKRKRNS
jgi:hypothetical protein